MLPDFRVRQRDYLLEIARAITEDLDFATVLRRILESAVELLAGQAGLIALREDEGRWHVRAYYGIPEAFIQYFDPLLADIPEHGDPQRFALPEINRRLRAITELTTLGLLQGVAIPMIVRGEVVGLIYIFRSYPADFSGNDRALLSSFAIQAAIAVQNAKLYQQVSQEKRRLDALLESSGDGVMIMTPAHRIQRFNRAMARLTGWTAAEAIGRTHDDVVHWARREPGQDLPEAEAGGWPLLNAETQPSADRSAQMNASTTAAGPMLYVEGDLLRKNGGITPVGITYTALFDREGRQVNLIADVHDITKFREAEELKSTFISIISHELKTPVALIKGYAETLKREDAKWDPGVVQESLAVIVEEADRLTDLIDKLLDASRLQAGALKLNLGEVALDQLAATLAEKFKTQSDKHTVLVEFPPDFPEIKGDEERLTQVLSNLLSNALKYSPNGGRVTLSGKVTPESVIISVSDEGPGIAAPDLPHVFDRFYRGDSDLTKRVKGTGLGLYLAKAVVEAHGGRIWVDSTPGEGATFSFSLPR
jgi:signal transduction histidine kinase